MEKLSSRRLKEIISRFSKKTVAVVGDFIADLYVFTLATRVSREAPVLILRYEGEKITLGGGANALNNVRALGARAIPVGFVGDDSEGKKLIEKMKELGIETDFVFASHRRTITKMRILAGSHHTVKQQVLRLDKEPEEPLSEPEKAKIFKALESLSSKVDAVILSDYGYKTVDTAVKDFVLEHFGDKIITADSRYNILSFKKVTAVTPNEPETAAALGLDKITDENIEPAGRKLLSVLETEAVLITRGKKGMALFTKDSPPKFIDIYGTDEVADVTGAGDTVIATFTLALASGANFYEAAKLANYAGGIVVMKMGTATVSQKELIEAVEDDLGE